MIQRFLWDRFMNMAPDQTLTKQSGENHKTSWVTWYQVAHGVWDTWYKNFTFITFIHASLSCVFCYTDELRTLAGIITLKRCPFNTKAQMGKNKCFLLQACWWFFPKTTSALRRPSSAAECWSGPPCSAPRAFCPRGSWELGSPRRTRPRCPACGRRTGGWCGPRAPRTTPALRRSRNLEREKERRGAG